MHATSSIIFRAILVALGLINIFLGLNVGFGGILTLGWQGQTEFFQITDEHAFLTQDSHVRFFGGLYAGIGLFLLVAATDLRKHQSALNLVLGLIFIGGLARFTMMRPEILFGPDIVGSLAAELVLMPVLAFWLSRIIRSVPAGA